MAMNTMLVPLNSLEGTQRLEESVRGNSNGCVLQQEIVDSFRKQRGNTVCGLASLAVVLTARKKSLAKENKPTLLMKDDNLFVDEDGVYPLTRESSCEIVAEEKIRKSGMTLDQVRNLVEALPTTDRVIAYFPGTGPSTNQQQTMLHKLLDLRELVVRVLSKPTHREALILNYHMSTLGQVPFGGHLSPVAAYHSDSDSLLVMDVWHTQTEPIWAPLQDVWTAISKVDDESQRPRGILHLVHAAEGDSG